MEVKSNKSNKNSNKKIVIRTIFDFIDKKEPTNVKYLFPYLFQILNVIKKNTIPVLTKHSNKESKIDRVRTYPILSIFFFFFTVFN